MMAQLPGGCKSYLLAAFWVLAWHLSWAQTEQTEVCDPYPVNVGPALPIEEGETVYRTIRRNETHRWFYSNYNMTTMSLPSQYRKLLIFLEPCSGVVFLFVRKTRHCYPDPYSCIDIRPGRERRSLINCNRTHYVSEINGSRDGAPTFFEMPLTSTQFFLSVYAPEESAYTLTILSDIGAFPRPGNSGRLVASQQTENSLQLSWDEAFYRPQGISTTLQYKVYLALLLAGDGNGSSKTVFLRPEKIMNTVCGLQNNTDTHYATVASDLCSFGTCNATVDGIRSDKQYVLNVVVESERGFKCAYAGLVAGTNSEVTEPLAADETVQAVGAVSGSVLGLMALSIGLMLKMTA